MRFPGIWLVLLLLLQVRLLLLQASIVPEGRGLPEPPGAEGPPKRGPSPSRGAPKETEKRGTGGTRAAEDRASTSTGHTH